MNKNLLI
ncbi:Uracil-DNA glycosylase, partial [Haemophilus influenzae]